MFQTKNSSQKNTTQKIQHKESQRKNSSDCHVQKTEDLIEES